MKIEHLSVTLYMTPYNKIRINFNLYLKTKLVYFSGSSQARLLLGPEHIRTDPRDPSRQHLFSGFGERERGRGARRELHC